MSKLENTPKTNPSSSQPKQAFPLSCHDAGPLSGEALKKCGLGIEEILNTTSPSKSVSPRLTPPGTDPFRLTTDKRPLAFANEAAKAKAHAGLHLKIENTPIDGIFPRANNPRTHNRAQRRLIRKALRKYGVINPIIIDPTGQIIVGNGVWRAAKEEGLTTVPTICISHLTRDELRAYALAENALAAKAGWDKELLAIELGELIDLGIDIEETGFEVAEVDLVIQEYSLTQAIASTRQDDQLPKNGGQVVTRIGDLWIADLHVYLCGDALSEPVYANLMAGKKAAMVCTDPPFNVPVSGHVSSLNVHEEFAMASGGMSPDEYQAFLAAWFSLAIAASRDGALHYVFIDWRHVYDALSAGRGLYGSLLQLCVWNKTNGGMGSFYRSKHELVLVFKIGAGKHTNNVELGRFGRNRTNVWDYEGANTFRKGRSDDLAMHPTVKPVAMIADAILDATRHGEVVLDLFGGSGTTMIAAEKTGRCARCIEIDPKYVDVAIRRWQNYTGRQAILAGTNLSFDEVAEQRSVN